MDNQPAFDRSLLIPIFIGGFSIIGIVIVLLVGSSLNSPAEVPVTPSATRLPYVYLGTEPAAITPLGDETEVLPTDDPFEEPDGEPTEEPGVMTPIARTPTRATTPTRPGAGTPIVLTLPNVTSTFSPATPTSASAPPLTAGTYDDVDSNIVYTGWIATNSGGTLHVSTVPGSTISFRFIGTQLRLRYQGGQTLGQIRITVDNVNETLDQSEGGNEWVWPNSLTNVTHTVLITHLSGGSVNLDQVIILAPATPTPTRTASLNP